MTPLGIAVRLGRLLGLHVSPLSQHPSRTMLGISEPDTIIDVGANIGQFAQEARRCFPRARLVSIEPLPSAFAKLERWAREDGNATAINCAVGAEEAVLPMNVCVDYEVSSSLLATSAAGVETYPVIGRQTLLEVPVRRLDDIVSCASDRNLLKIDVQGFEEAALTGAQQTLAKVAAVLVEINLTSIYEGQATFAGIYERMTSAGLSYAGNYSQSYGRNGHVVYIDALFQR